MTSPARPLISIVTPTFNALTWLRHCRASVVAQVGARFEHIIVDGGSTDGTTEWLASQRGLGWISEPDEGQADAIRKGFALASGDVISWLNADDELLPGALEAVAEHFAGRQAEVLMGACTFRDGAGRTLRVVQPPSALRLSALADDVPVPQPSLFMRTSTLTAIGGLDTTKHLAMDADLWIRLAASGVRARHTRRPLSIFTLHPSSKTGSRPYSEFLEEAAESMRKVDPVRAEYMRGRLWAARELEDGAEFVNILANARILPRERARGATSEVVRRIPWRDVPVAQLQSLRGGLRPATAVVRVSATRAVRASREHFFNALTA